MITVNRKKFGIPIRDVFFASEPAAMESGSTISYFLQAHRPHPGFSPFKTLIVDLTESEEDLFARLSSNTRYKIKRGEREGLLPEVDLAPSEERVRSFAEYFDEFARQKGIPVANRTKLSALREAGALVLASMTNSDRKLLCAHAYVSDRSLQRVRLLYSASHFRGAAASADKNLIGRANRYLHWFEIMEFRKHGYREYDFGGFAVDSPDPALQAIAKFKQEFGGSQVVEYNGFVPGNQVGRLILALKRKML